MWVHVDRGVLCALLRSCYESFRRRVPSQVTGREGRPGSVRWRRPLKPKVSSQTTQVPTHPSCRSYVGTDPVSEGPHLPPIPSLGSSRPGHPLILSSVHFILVFEMSTSRCRFVLRLPSTAGDRVKGGTFRGPPLHPDDPTRPVALFSEDNKYPGPCHPVLVLGLSSGLGVQSRLFCRDTRVSSPEAYSADLTLVSRPALVLEGPGLRVTPRAGTWVGRRLSRRRGCFGRSDSGTLPAPTRSWNRTSDEELWVGRIVGGSRCPLPRAYRRGRVHAFTTPPSDKGTLVGTPTQPPSP